MQTNIIIQILISSQRGLIWTDGAGADSKVWLDCEFDLESMQICLFAITTEFAFIEIHLNVRKCIGENTRQTDMNMPYA